MERLFVSDLDGTLLDPAGKLSDYTRSALTGLLGEGLPFTIASARSVISMRAILGDLPLSLPVIEMNGAFLSDYPSARHHLCRAMPLEVCEEVAAHATGVDMPPFVSTFDGREDRLYYCGDLRNDGMRWYLENRRRMGDDRLRGPAEIHTVLREQVVCLTVIGRREAIEGATAWLLERFGDAVAAVHYENRYCRGWYWLTVQDRLATKARGLATLTDMCGVDMADVTVFGDDVNDVAMFREAGRAIAPENAEATLKRYAAEVIKHHETDSVVRYLEGAWDGPEGV
jgi:hydroxymethylpyrimidine pyrophosphatase-like HAD family hydrolase